MRYNNKHINSFAYGLVCDYAKYDRLSDSFEMTIDDLSDVERHELAALLMQDNPDLAAETTGFDNPLYEEVMLPALTRFIGSTDPDDRIEFNSIWKDSIASYLRNRMISIIEEQLEEYNLDQAA